MGSLSVDRLPVTALWSDYLPPFTTFLVPAATPLSPLTSAQGQGWEVVAVATRQPCGPWLLTPGALSNHDDHNLLPITPCQLVHEYHLEREEDKQNQIDTMDRWTNGWTKEQKGDACATERTLEMSFDDLSTLFLSFSLRQRVSTIGCRWGST